MTIHEQHPNRGRITTANAAILAEKSRKARAATSRLLREHLVELLVHRRFTNAEAVRVAKLPVRLVSGLIVVIGGGQ